MAAWDLFARQQDVPLARAARRHAHRDGSPPASRSASRIRSTQLARAGRQRARRRLSPRSRSRSSRDGTSSRASWSAHAFGDIPLMVDANAAYTLADADHLARARPLRPDDDRAAARVRRHPRSRARCSADRGRRSASTSRSTRPRRAEEALIALGACRIINIKPGRVGGHAAVDPHARYRASRTAPRLARRHAGKRHRPRAQYPSVDAAGLHAAGRRRRQPPLLRARPDRSGDRGAARWHDRGADRARHRRARRRATASTAPPIERLELRQH